MGVPQHQVADESLQGLMYDAMHVFGAPSLIRLLGRAHRRCHVTDSTGVRQGRRPPVHCHFGHRMTFKVSKTLPVTASQQANLAHTRPHIYTVGRVGGGGMMGYDGCRDSGGGSGYLLASAWGCVSYHTPCTYKSRPTDAPMISPLQLGPELEANVGSLIDATVTFSFPSFLSAILPTRDAPSRPDGEVKDR